MEDNHILKQKWKDYRRFTAILLILSFYMCMGAIIKVHVQYSSDGSIAVMALLTTIVAGVCCYRCYRLQLKINEDERT